MLTTQLVRVREGITAARTTGERCEFLGKGYADLLEFRYADGGIKAFPVDPDEPIEVFNPFHQAIPAGAVIAVSCSERSWIVSLPPEPSSDLILHPLTPGISRGEAVGSLSDPRAKRHSLCRSRRGPVDPRFDSSSDPGESKGA